MSKWNFESDAVEYKGYTIEYNFYGNDDITVQYCGDDIIFNSIEDAKEFIDGLV